MTSKRPRPKISMLLLQGREVGAADFKARCLEIMDEVQKRGISVTITKHRKPVARLVPADAQQEFYGSLKGLILSQGDLVSPIDEEWEADAANLT